MHRLYDDKPSKESVPVNVNSPAEVDPPLPAPQQLPTYTPKCSRERYDQTATYSYLETNIDAHVMEFSQEIIPDVRSDASVSMYGPTTPFRHHTVMQKYLQDLCNRDEYSDHIEFKTTVEKAQKKNGEWVLTLRRSGDKRDYWWKEHFDAIVASTGHYNVPIVPDIKGLREIEKEYPGVVEHTKNFRGRENYRGKVCFREC